MEEAVWKVFNLGTKILKEWPKYAQFFARTATNLVGMLHLLQLGAGSMEGKLAKSLKEAVAQGDLQKKKDAVVANPSESKPLVLFYAGAVVERKNAAHAKKQPRSAAATSRPSPCPFRLLRKGKRLGKNCASS